MAKLHLVRHSEPAWRTELPPSKWVLTGQGKIRSRELGVYLGKQGVSRIFSSDENKAVETAEIDADVAGIKKVIIDSSLREHDRDNAPRPPSKKRDDLIIDCIRNPDKLIWGNETVSEATNRFGEVVERFLAYDQTENVAIVSHGTVISMFVAQQLNIDPVSLWKSMGLPWLIEIDWPNPTKIFREINFNSSWISE